MSFLTTANLRAMHSMCLELAFGQDDPAVADMLAVTRIGVNLKDFADNWNAHLVTSQLVAADNGKTVMRFLVQGDDDEYHGLGGCLIEDLGFAQDIVIETVAELAAHGIDPVRFELPIEDDEQGNAT
jgi:hypothetical protein